MDDPVDEQYFEWLYDQAHRDRREGKGLTYTIVSGIMHRIPFKDNVSNDDNRTAEGKELRMEFIEEHGLTMFPQMAEFLDEPVSFFEMLVALCRRCDFQVELGVDNWFYVFIQNLNLSEYADNDIATKNKGVITRVINKVNNRTYSPNGKGGLFPLNNPRSDQREVELWYQMSYYIVENDLI